MKRKHVINLRRDHPRYRSAMWIYTFGYILKKLYIPSFIEIRLGVSGPWEVKIWHFPLLLLLAFTTAACLTVYKAWCINTLVSTHYANFPKVLITQTHKQVSLIFVLSCTMV